MMLEINHTWTSTGSTSGWNTPVKLDFPCVESVLSVSASSIASTTSFQFQTAQESTGPWAVEGSTSISADANNTSLDRIRVTGPFTWMRPVLKTAVSGTYTFKLLGVS